jgi:hypothetical protein
MGSKTSPKPTFIETPAFRDALAVWARIGLLSFGRPAGQISRRWTSRPWCLFLLLRLKLSIGTTLAISASAALAWFTL